MYAKHSYYIVGFFEVFYWWYLLKSTFIKIACQTYFLMCFLPCILRTAGKEHTMYWKLSYNLFRMLDSFFFVDSRLSVFQNECMLSLKFHGFKNELHKYLGYFLVKWLKEILLNFIRNCILFYRNIILSHNWNMCLFYFRHYHMLLIRLFKTSFKTCFILLISIKCGVDTIVVILIENGKSQVWNVLGNVMLSCFSHFLFSFGNEMKVNDEHCRPTFFYIQSYTKLLHIALRCWYIVFLFMCLKSILFSTTTRNSFAF